MNTQKRVLVLLVFAFIFGIHLFSLAQAPDVVVAGTVGNTGVTNNPTSNATVNFKATYQIVIGPDFYTSNYDLLASGTSYFRAYLVPPANYAELKNKLDGSFAITIDNIIYFKYHEKYAGGVAPSFKVYDYQRNVMTTSQVLPASVTGANFYQLDIKQFPGILAKDLSKEENTYYTLEIVNAKGELFQLRFKYFQVL